MDDEPRRKRSNIVILTLVGLPIGAVALANAFPPETLRRNLYTDRAACERDYLPSQCQSGTGSSYSSSGHGWHGPYYAADRTTATTGDPGPGRTGQLHPTQVSTRGGFGAIGRGLRAVG